PRTRRATSRFGKWSATTRALRSARRAGVWTAPHSPLESRLPSSKSADSKSQPATKSTAGNRKGEGPGNTIHSACPRASRRTASTCFERKLIEADASLVKPLRRTEQFEKRGHAVPPLLSETTYGP